MSLKRIEAKSKISLLICNNKYSLVMKIFSPSSDVKYKYRIKGEHTE